MRVHRLLQRPMSPLILLLFTLLTCCLITPSVGVQFSSPTYVFTPVHDPGSSTNAYFPTGVRAHTMALFAPDPATYNNVTGQLWQDTDGSKVTFCNPTIPNNAVAGKIVLALRGECDFLTRARNAATLNAAGLIIGDNKDSADFDTEFMGPYIQDPPAVNIPVIFVLGQTYDELTRSNLWATTTATISTVGLYANMDAYYTLVGELNPVWQARIRTLLYLSPFIMVLFCYVQWFKTYRDRQPGAAGAGAAAAPAQPPAQVPGQPQPGQAEGQAPSEVPPPPAVAVSSSPSYVAPPHRPSFSEQEMTTISLPTPPHLSGGDVVLDVGASSPSATRSGRSRSLDESAEHKESEGLMSSDSVSSSSSAAIPSASSQPSLNRPLMVPTPTVALHLRLYYHFLKFLSAAGKPTLILRFNAFIYLIHVISSISVLIIAWNERCVTENLAAVSLWCARAMIGFRVCYWQCHSQTSGLPTCADIFFKNWSDCIYLFTGSMFTWNQDQKEDCQLNAPTIYSALQIWTICIYITYGSRIVFYLLDRYSQTHTATLPHFLTIGARSCLNIVNGGFSCAGPLDKNQPASQLDLMLIPTQTYQVGMYPMDDALCGICLGEYQIGDQLRVLNCSHHFHQGCVDTWLLRKNNCPTCRASIDDAPVRRSPAPVSAAAGSPRSSEPLSPHGGIVDVDAVEIEEELSRDRPPSPSQTGHSSYYSPAATSSANASRMHQQHI